MFGLFPMIPAARVDNRNPSYRKRGPGRKHRQGSRDLDRAVRPAGLNGRPINAR